MLSLDSVTDQTNNPPPATSILTHVNLLSFFKNVNKSNNFPDYIMQTAHDMQNVSNASKCTPKIKKKRICLTLPGWLSSEKKGA